MIDPFPSVIDPDDGMRAEFGEMARQTGRMLNARHDAQITGAENLLTKAIRALAAGDGERSEQLVQRAAQMPYDAREQESPGVAAASLLVYGIIEDQLEASDHDDMTWLDVVLNVYSDLDSSGRAEVASVVHGFVLQEAFFTVSPAEKQRIRQAFGHAPLEAELGDGPSSTVEQRRDIIRSLILAARALGDAYAAAAETRSG